MHLTEAAFLATAFVCFVLAVSWKGTRSQLKRDTVAAIGGIATGFGVIMPLELAPFFFGTRGEIMLATIGLSARGGSVHILVPEIDERQAAATAVANANKRSSIKSTTR